MIFPNAALTLSHISPSVSYSSASMSIATRILTIQNPGMTNFLCKYKFYFLLIFAPCFDEFAKASITYWNEDRCVRENPSAQTPIARINAESRSSRREFPIKIISLFSNSCFNIFTDQTNGLNENGAPCMSRSFTWSRMKLLYIRTIAFLYYNAQYYSMLLEWKVLLKMFMGQKLPDILLATL